MWRARLWRAFDRDILLLITCWAAYAQVHQIINCSDTQRMDVNEDLAQASDLMTVLTESFKTLFGAWCLSFRQLDFMPPDSTGIGE